MMTKTLNREEAIEALKAGEKIATNEPGWNGFVTYDFDPFGLPTKWREVGPGSFVEDRGLCYAEFLEYDTWRIYEPEPVSVEPTPGDKFGVFDRIGVFDAAGEMLKEYKWDKDKGFYEINGEELEIVSMPKETELMSLLDAYDKAKPGQVLKRKDSGGFYVEFYNGTNRLPAWEHLTDEDTTNRLSWDDIRAADWYITDLPEGK